MEPYKGFEGKITGLDEKQGLIHGIVTNITDVVAFEGKNVEELIKAFRDSVDDYLEFCEKPKFLYPRISYNYCLTSYSISVEAFENGLEFKTWIPYSDNKKEEQTFSDKKEEQTFSFRNSPYSTNTIDRDQLEKIWEAISIFRRLCFGVFPLLSTNVTKDMKDNNMPPPGATNCPHCRSDLIQSKVDVIEFVYGKNKVPLKAKVINHHCRSCITDFLDRSSEDQKTKAILDYMGREKE